MNLCPQCLYLRPKLARPGLCRACKAASARVAGGADLGAGGGMQAAVVGAALGFGCSMICSLNLLKHALRMSADMAPRSLLDCHHKGLDSLMIHDQGKIKRLFIKHAGTMLGPDDIAYHRHHCDVTLEPVVGSVTNSDAVVTPDGKPFGRWFYQSKIRDGAGGFSRAGSARLSLSSRPVAIGQPPIMLHARQLHTVTAGPDFAAWLVHEGEEWPGYDATTYARRDLSGWSAEGLYRPMSIHVYGEMLRAVIDMAVR